MSLILDGSNGLSDVDGTAATPAIRGTDANTGIFFPAADTIAFSEGGTEAMRIDSAGNLGVGITSPTAKVHVSAPDGTAPLTLNSAGGSDTTRALNFNVAGDNYGKILVPSGSGGAMAFWTGGANAAVERMRIDSAGNLYVNATSQTFGEKFKVVNSGSGNNAAFFWFDDASNDRGAVLVKNTRASGATSGSMMAFLNSSNSAVGSITSTGSATTYSTSSDYRLKENIAPMTGALSTVSALKPCTYTWKENGQASQGFIAHELQEICPDAVVGEKDAVNEDGSIKAQGIDTSFLVATLTAAIQELKATVDAQAARIAALEAK
jgi:hypothetical protein